VACVAALAVLEVVEEHDLPAETLKNGEYLTHKLTTLAAENDIIGDIRGSGLFMGLELVRERDSLEPAVEETAKLVNLLRVQGVLINSTGVFDNVLKIRSPMVFNAEHANFLVERMAGALEEIRVPVRHSG